MADEDDRECKQDKPVVHPGEGVPHGIKVHLAACQVEEYRTDQATDDQPSGVASKSHASVVPIFLAVSLDRADGVTGFAGFIAGLDMKIDLRAFGKEIAN